MRLKTQVARLEKHLGAGEDDQRLQDEFDACYVVIHEYFDAFAKQVPGASLQSEEFQSAINRFFEIAVAMGRCTWREIEQAAEKCDALLARYESSSERRAHVRDSNGIFVGQARRGG